MFEAVPTGTFQENLKSATDFAECGWCVLLQGPGSSGKTTVAVELAKKKGVHMKTINIDDTFDAKDILGKFSATDVPGVFEWVPGPLTEAVLEGSWILLEDIDLASFDVFSVLLPLITTGKLFVADKGVTHTAHENFRLIATQQLNEVGPAILNTKKMNNIPNPELWPTVMVIPPTPDEVISIVQNLFPTVPLEPLSKMQQLLPKKYCGLRSCLKWAGRVREVHSSQQKGFLSSNSREFMFMEAYDVVAAGVPPSVDRDNLIATIAESCGVPLEIARGFVFERKPQLVSTRDMLKIGRVTLEAAGSHRMRESFVAFAETKHSMTLLERIAGALKGREPVLLTGETGVGKTFIVQYLADNIGQELVVHNLNQQTDSSDFMGGWKPRDLSQQFRKLSTTFASLFEQTFNVEKNRAFLQSVVTAVDSRSWDAVLIQLEKGVHLARASEKVLSNEEVLGLWESFSNDVHDMKNIVHAAKTSFMFTFEEGSLVRAWREGQWILLDEVNLATNEVLERVASVLGGSDKLVVSERGSSEEIPRHPNFRVFANMNPPTDVGKKDLPPALRSRFTEFYVPDSFDPHDLQIVVSTYLSHLSADAKVSELVVFFMECVKSSRSALCDLDGETKPPHFSLRSLTRALNYIRQATPLYGFNTAILDGLMMSFASPLQRKFHAVIFNMIVTTVFKGRSPAQPSLPKQPPNVDPSKRFLAYEHIWLELGPEAAHESNAFIVTATVKDHLKNIARAVFTKRPVLLEGPTSAGKSSMIQYLAELTGHKFVRINNHESTEIQEYLGHYVSDENGKLRFVDGCLTSAVRHGHWVVLDELNLAPTEVLEALNRLLDDNCELFIADTQETVRPHPSLRIFATQNPSGIYGGRKMLSRAFRNRFLEITVDDIPTSEIQEILCKRYNLAPTFAEKMVETMKMLQLRRQSSDLFAGRHGFITPRDLFRWADRKAMDYQSLAEHGFLLLGERCRKKEEKQMVKDVIEKVMRVMIDDHIYDPNHWPFTKEHFKRVGELNLKDRIVWTVSMQRLFTIVGLCLEHKEPVLLVGETGCSKTTICQVWSAVLAQNLHIVNCHQHSEASDFLGSLRPTPLDKKEDGLFLWQDGPLIRSMRNGDIFVLDEISLAEDSVLERLNSVLEPSRTITLAEKSTGEVVVAVDLFRVLATMNPGGDFGKKELSPALRNRFTEVYVLPITAQDEITEIIQKRLPEVLFPFASHMANLLCTVAQKRQDNVVHISIRDVIGWADFMVAANGRMDASSAFWHGLDAVLLDGLSVGGGLSDMAVVPVREACKEAARALLPDGELSLGTPFWEICQEMQMPAMPEDQKRKFNFEAPTTKKNTSKIMRATLLRKAIMLEGSPGVGKTSIVEAIGTALGRHVVRINLSEQTDMMDLLGAFLPKVTDDATDGPVFEWSDGILLDAVRCGHWVILDELNLASQSVLEGLNALLDHRSTVYLPELCKEVAAHTDFRVFACQNPLVEGGGRKGLPKSFLNRFTKVRVDAFTHTDLMQIVTSCTTLPEEKLDKMVRFACALQEATMGSRLFGHRGSPWEFNLRDVLRWGHFMSEAGIQDPVLLIDTLFLRRFRTQGDRIAVKALVENIFHVPIELHDHADISVGESGILTVSGVPAGIVDATRQMNASPLLLPTQTAVIGGILRCAFNNQFCVVVGPSSSGKSSALKVAADLAGASLDVFSMTAGCDTIDLLGGFDQVEGRQGHFEWRDSVIIRAMEEGRWVVLDNANFCSASVLDRLNSVVEPNGVLVVNEQGLVDGCVRIVKPHKSFRLFATMDPRFGELSRAFRNRAVEIYVPPAALPSQDSMTIAAAATGFSNINELLRLSVFHQEFVSKCFFADSMSPLDGKLADAMNTGSPTVGTFLRAVEMSRRHNFKDALQACYIRNRSGSWVLQRDAITSSLSDLDSVLADSACAPTDSLLHASKLNGTVALALDNCAAARFLLMVSVFLTNDVAISETTWSGFSLYVYESIRRHESSASRVEAVARMAAALIDRGAPEMLLKASQLSRHSDAIRRLIAFEVHVSPKLQISALSKGVPSNIVNILAEILSTSKRTLLVADDQHVSLQVLGTLRLVLNALSQTFVPTASVILPILTAISILVDAITNFPNSEQKTALLRSLFAALSRLSNIQGELRPLPHLLKHGGQPHALNEAERALLNQCNEAKEIFYASRSEPSKLLEKTWLQAAFRYELELISAIVSGFTTGIQKQEGDSQRLFEAYKEHFVGKLCAFTEMEVSDLAVVLARRLDARSANACVPRAIVYSSRWTSKDSACAMIPGLWVVDVQKTTRLAKTITLRECEGINNSAASVALDLLQTTLKGAIRPIDAASTVRKLALSELMWISHVFGVDARGKDFMEVVDQLAEVLPSSLGFQEYREPLSTAVEHYSLMNSCVLGLVVQAMKLQLVCTTSLIDPMLVHFITKKIGDDESEYFAAVRKSFETAETINFSTGAGSKGAAIDVATTLFSKMAAEAAAKHTPRPDPSGVRFVELVTFQMDLCSGLLSSERINRCIAFLTSDPRSSKRQRSEMGSESFIREEVENWTALLRTSAQEMSKRFVGYEDFMLPFAQGLHLLAFHAEIAIEQNRSQESCRFAPEDAARLMQFPCVSPIVVSPPLTIDNHFSDSVLLLEASLTEAQAAAHVGLSSGSAIFDAFAHLFSAIEELNRSEMQQEQLSVMYKEKAIVIEGDDERNLRRLKAMFPDYEKEFEDELSTDDAAPSDEHRVARQARVLFGGHNGKRIRSVSETHERLYDVLTHVHRAGDIDRIRAFEARFDSLGHQPVITDTSGEHKLIGGCLARMKIIKTQISQCLTFQDIDIQELISRSFNIYLESEPAEMGRIAKVLVILLERVSRLREEYPENPVLERVLKFGRRLQGYPVFETPLMRVVAGAEVLLRECYEWERNASKEVSIMHHINAISACVLRWRRLELHCWPHIFVAKEEEFATRAVQKWFDIRALIQKIIQDPSSLDIPSLFGYLNEYMWSTNIGEFHHRLAHLRAFAQEVQFHQGHSLKAVVNVLLHTFAYFSQFSALIKEKIVATKTPLQEDLQEYCKIMRWEDATYYAVRSSTHKSHLRISRILVELEEGLRCPILQVITKSEEDRFDQMPVACEATPAAKPTKEAKPIKEKIVKKKRSRKDAKVDVEEEVAPVSVFDGTWPSPQLQSAVEFFTSTCDDVSSRISELQKPKMPQNLKTRALKQLFEVTEENGLCQTHERALPGWLNLFSTADLSPVVRTTHRLKSEFGSVISPADAEAVERHFYSSVRHVQKMRECETNPHADLTMGQVKKGTGMTETLLALTAGIQQTIQGVTETKDLVRALQRAAIFASTSANPTVSDSRKVVRNFQSIAVQCLELSKQMGWYDGSRDGSVDRDASLLLSECDQLLELSARCDYRISKAEFDKLLHALKATESSLENFANTTSFAAAKEVAREILHQINIFVAAKLDSVRNSDITWSSGVFTALRFLDFPHIPTEQPIVLEAAELVHAEIRNAVTSANEALSALVSRPNNREVHASEQEKILAAIADSLSTIDSVMKILLMWCESVSKFCVVMAKLMSILMKKGFCKTEDEDEAEGDGGEGQQQEGTGMDDGKGEKDVTDEIENEDQLMNMKDKEQKEDDAPEADDKDKAAEVETDFQADKEQRSESDDEGDEEGDESDVEMGSVDDEDQRDRKKTRKEKNDGDMSEDDGGAAEEVPEDELADKEDKDEIGSDNDDETNNYGNKEKEIRDGEGDNESEKSMELIGDNDSDFEDKSDESDNGDEKSKSGDGSDEEVAESVDEDAEGDDGKGSEQSREDSDEDPDRQEDVDGDGEKNNDAEPDMESGSDNDGDQCEDNDISAPIDQNNDYTGEQDEEQGAENAQNEKRDRKQDDAGAENEEQQGAEQEMNEQGRDWKKRDKNDESQRKSQNEQNQASKQQNPFQAMKEAMLRHNQRMRQLNLDKNVQLKDDDKEQHDDDASIDGDDDFEIHEKGAGEGMAPTDEVLPSVADAPEMKEDKDKSDDAPAEGDEPTEAPEDKNMKRQKESDETEVKAADDKSKDKRKGKNKSVKLMAKADEEPDTEDDNVVEECATAIDDSIQRGRDLWYELEASVSGHSQQLCEQLRLILAPTEADKLQGDYKTGKRINIKKIIPYIASQFKKDRIWLRRTKPNKRSYQILIALDDSLSMMKNSAGRVSCEAVALLSKALQQLEVGEFSVIRFGKETKIIHQLADSFGADSGPRIFSEFSFSQTSTNMRLFLQTALDYMDVEGMRLGGTIRSTTQQLRQILFVVSDGQITEDRTELRKLLARAEENGQVVVLLILDIQAQPQPSSDAQAAVSAAPQQGGQKLSLAETMRRHNASRDQRLTKTQKGVLDMQIVEFEGTKVVKKPYLDNFPFPFYIVIQDIPSLPTTLADAMRQWFEIIANSS